MLGATVIVICVNVVLWVLTIMLMRQYARLGKIGCKQSADDIKHTSLPSVAVVILAQEEADKLEKHLTLFLNQHYPQDYQVIVVDIHSTDGTLKLLEKMEETYHNLSHSSVPASARDISMQRLAMTLGVRTACTDWVVFTQADCYPESEEWLASFMNAVTPEKNAIIGFTKYAACDNWLMQKRQFFRLWQQMVWIPFAENHYPYRADDTILAYRKEYFFSHNGFASDSKLMVGAATLLVNKNISCQQCGISISRKATLLQENPLPHTWHQEEVFFMETRRHMTYKHLYRTWYALRVLVPILFTLSCIASVILLALQQQYIIISVLAILWLYPYIVRDKAYNKTARQFNIKSCHLTLPYLCTVLPLWDMMAWIKWRFTNKREFRKKFV